MGGVVRNDRDFSMAFFAKYFSNNHVDILGAIILGVDGVAKYTTNYN